MSTVVTFWTKREVVPIDKITQSGNCYNSKRMEEDCIYNNAEKLYFTATQNQQCQQKNCKKVKWTTIKVSKLVYDLLQSTVQ